jgi:hypothetical protein
MSFVPKKHPPFNFNDWSYKPVYDLSYYGIDIPVYVMDPSLTLVSVTNSATTFAVATSAPTPIDNNDLVLSNTDLMPLAGGANNTDINTTYVVLPDMTAAIFEAHVSVAFGMNVSAWTSGTVTFVSVQMIVSYNDTGEVLFDTGTINTGLTGLGATGSQLFLLNSDVNFKPAIIAQSGRAIRINLKTNSTATLTNTRQMGIYPNFSFNKQLSPAVPIFYTPSRILFHIHPTLDHAQAVFTAAMGTQNQIDFSGTNVNGNHIE